MNQNKHLLERQSAQIVMPVHTPNPGPVHYPHTSVTQPAANRITVGSSVPS